MPRFAAKDYRRTGRIDNMVKDLNGALRAVGQPNEISTSFDDVRRIVENDSPH